MTHLGPIKSCRGPGRFPTLPFLSNNNKRRSSKATRSSTFIDKLADQTTETINSYDLAMVSRAILCITATSVPSECLFSKAGLIETDLRNILNPSRLGQITFLKANMLFLN